jgi:hypothetical protein
VPVLRLQRFALCMHAVTPRGSPACTARELHVLQYATTQLDLRVADGPRPQQPAARPVTATWAQYVAIGLGPRHPPRSRRATAIIAAYRLLGFVVLAVIVVVLLGYIATTVFFMVSRTWIVPTVISPSDEHVLALQTELTTHQTQRDRVAAELADAERAVAAEERFQLAFAAAMAADLVARQAELVRVRALATDASATRRNIHGANRAFATQHGARLAREYQARLVDRSGMIDGKLQLAQISGSSLALAEKQAELDTRAAELAAAVAGLSALVASQPGNVPLSYDVLTIKRSYDASKLALAKARDTRAMHAAQLLRQQQLIDSLEQSGYLRALRDGASVAAVPYDNIANAGKGSPLYACRAAMLLCKRVGSVLEVLPGEVTLRHPHRARQLRGRMIELQLDEPDAARDDVLFVGGAPLWL